MALDWIHEYAKINVSIGVNSPRIAKELKHIIPRVKILLLQNYYPLSDKIPSYKRSSDDLNIGCFGAIRPMKNHLLQAICAIKFADNKKLKLNFHINSNRCEGKGEPILRNLRALFNNSNHNLIEHTWMDHSEFLKVIASMDISMQVSFSETFNIVTADAVSMNVPVVVSPEISWTNCLYQAKPTCSEDIIKTLNVAWYSSKIGTQRLNFYGLEHYDHEVKELWSKTIAEI
jgi:hypothetical protein